MSMVDKSQAKFPRLRAVSFDKGFHSPSNRQALEKRLELVALPKKGRHSVADRERETAPGFVQARHQHSAVESAINGLESFGLDLCPDHGIAGFKRYVALAVLAMSCSVWRRASRRSISKARSPRCAASKAPAPPPTSKASPICCRRG